MSGMQRTHWIRSDRRADRSARATEKSGAIDRAGIAHHRLA
jgi:hypothetical protein